MARASLICAPEGDFIASEVIIDVAVKELRFNPDVEDQKDYNVRAYYTLPSSLTDNSYRSSLMKLKFLVNYLTRTS